MGHIIPSEFPKDNLGHELNHELMYQLGRERKIPQAWERLLTLWESYLDSKVVTGEGFFHVRPYLFSLKHLFWHHTLARAPDLPTTQPTRARPSQVHGPRGAASRFNPGGWKFCWVSSLSITRPASAQRGVTGNPRPVLEMHCRFGANILGG